MLKKKEHFFKKIRLRKSVFEKKFNVSLIFFRENLQMIKNTYAAKLFV